METTRAERIKIGAFMLLCGIMICIFLGYVLSRFLNKEYDNYYTVFSDSVIGLYKDAQVKLNGIDVGNVTEIAIDSSNLNQVIVHFRVNKGTPIKIGTRAGMTHGISLTGEKQIVLSGLNVSSGAVLELGPDSMDRFLIHAGTTNYLSCRSMASADDLVLPAGIATVSLVSSVAGTAGIRVRGRWL